MIHYITTNGIGNAWVAAEVQRIQDQGVPCVIHSMRAPHQNFYGSDWAERINKETRLIYPINPFVLLWAVLLAPIRFRGRFFSALTNALFASRESLRARVSCLFHLGVACLWANGLRRQDVHLIHSQWIQSGGTIGWYAGWLLDKPFSFTGHAVDLFRDRSALRDKIRSAHFIVAISEFHRRFYIEEGANNEKIHTVYCGIDLEDFSYRYRPIGTPTQINSFGRLVEKKGFDTLIEACALLRDRGRDFRCTIGGDGPDEEELRLLIRKFGLDDIVELKGEPILQENLPAWLDRADVFAQPCRWSADNDVDGIPRSLMEAMAIGLPSVTTDVAGLPDLVIDGESGLLVQPNNPSELADALERIIVDTALAEKLSRGGRRQVEQRFNLDTCLEPLGRLFREMLERP